MRRLLLFFGVIGLVLAFASPAYAQEGAIQEPFFELDSTVTMFVAGTLIPLLVGIITKLRAPSWLKAIVHALLAAVAGFVNAAINLDGVAVVSRESLVLIFMTWITGIAAYFGFLTPTGISPAVNTATANVGIGGNVTHSPGE